MYILVIYDISDDKMRLRISERLKDYGLKRIQYSAFFGKLNRNRREEMMMRVNDYMIQTHGSIIMIPICEKDKEQIIKMENIDYEMKEVKEI